MPADHHAELKELLEQRAQKRLVDVAESLGIASFTRANDVFLRPAAVWRRLRVPERDLRPMVIGEAIRDWGVDDVPVAAFPYDADFAPRPPQGQLLLALWPFRTTLGANNKVEGSWFEYGRLAAATLRTPLTIAFAGVATHNRCVLDRGGRLFDRSAPIIKLPESATEDDHLALLAYLNSSTAAFWFRQAGHAKGAPGAEVWEQSLEYSSALVGSLPLPPAIAAMSSDKVLDLEAARLRRAICALAVRMDRMAREQAVYSLAAVLERWRPGAVEIFDAVERSVGEHMHRLCRLCELQDDLDWLLYEAFGLLPGADRAELAEARRVVDEENAQRRSRLAPDARIFHGVDGILPGRRPFEILLARRLEKSGGCTAWFERNRYEEPTRWEDDYLPDQAELIETRVGVISRRPVLSVLEQPEHKQRWVFSDYREDVRLAGAGVICGALEQAFRNTISSAAAITRAAPLRRRVGQISELVEREGAARLRAPELMAGEAVPFLAALRFTASGLQKHAAWLRTWDLQRREDAGEDVGEIPVPPEYDQSDYRDSVSWRLRGKLDVPKETFISYPGCESDEGEEPLFGWAGWDHLQRAQALEALYQDRKTRTGWGGDRLTPMLAGLLELLPWIKQWHDAPSDKFGGRNPGDYFETFLGSECTELGLTEDDLRSWRPPERERRGDRQPKALVAHDGGKRFD